MKHLAITLLTALAIGGGAARAQNYLVDNPDNKPYLGIRLGLDISSTAGQTFDTYGNGAGFTIGGIYNIPLWKNLYFEPGLSLFYDTFDQNVLTGEEALFEIDGSIRNFGFRVPLNIGYHFDFTDDLSLQVFTGPVLNLNLTAKSHFDGLGTHSIMENGFKRFDMQWDFGVGLTYNQHYYVSVSGGVGITKAMSTPVESFRRNTCNIALGYNF